MQRGPGNIGRAGLPETHAPEPHDSDLAMRMAKSQFFLDVPLTFDHKEVAFSRTNLKTEDSPRWVADATGSPAPGFKVVFWSWENKRCTHPLLSFYS